MFNGELRTPCVFFDSQACVFSHKSGCALSPVLHRAKFSLYRTTLYAPLRYIITCETHAAKMRTFYGKVTWSHSSDRETDGRNTSKRNLCFLLRVEMVTAGITVIGMAACARLLQCLFSFGCRETPKTASINWRLWRRPWWPKNFTLEPVTWRYLVSVVMLMTLCVTQHISRPYIYLLFFKNKIRRHLFSRCIFISNNVTSQSSAQLLLLLLLLYLYP